MSVTYKGQILFDYVHTRFPVIHLDALRPPRVRRLKRSIPSGKQVRPSCGDRQIGAASQHRDARLWCRAHRCVALRSPDLPLRFRVALKLLRAPKPQRECKYGFRRLFNARLMLHRKHKRYKLKCKVSVGYVSLSRLIHRSLCVQSKSFITYAKKLSYKSDDWAAGSNSCCVTDTGEIIVVLWYKQYCISGKRKGGDTQFFWRKTIPAFWHKLIYRWTLASQ